MTIRKTLLALLALVALAAASNEEPRLEVQSDRVSVKGFVPGERVAWAGLVRTPVGNLDRVRVVRGVGIVGDDGELSIEETIGNRSRATWLLSRLNANGTQRSFRIGAFADADPADIAITVGATTISVEAAAIDLTYILPDGKAFYFFGADGSTLDADGDQNGTILINLSSLKIFGSPSSPLPVPTATHPGDIIQVFDVYEWRRTDMVVAQ
ncbi:MAG: hypothetical protein JWO97_4137 [Acidobacteria bacterium]|nr:hypothetical protein [Acidobacteriota bacterium]